MSSTVNTVCLSLAANESIPLLRNYCAQQALVIDNNRVITQAEFLRDLHCVAAQLPHIDFAFNVCEDRYFFLLAFCAAVLNNTVNLLPPTRQRVTLNNIAADYKECYCLTDSEIESDLQCTNIRSLLASKSAITESDLPSVPAQQLAAIAFTSGSTGTPTANKKYWGTLAGTARLLASRLTEHLSLPAIVATVPSQHMYGLEMTIMMALQGNCRMHRQKPFFPADIHAFLKSTPSPVMLVTTPVHLRALVNSEMPMPELAGIISATAPLDLALAEKAEHFFVTNLHEIYGCTEAGSMATRQSTEADDWHLLNGFSLTETANGVTASAPHLAELAPLQDHLDISADNYFKLLGRNADMINVAGKRASLADLTLRLLRIDGVIDGVIFLPDEKDRERPAAFVVTPLSETELSEKDIIHQLAQQIDPAFLPRPVRKVTALPRNETGKLTHAALQALWNQIHE